MTDDTLRGQCFHLAIDQASGAGDITLIAANPTKRIAVVHHCLSVDAAAAVKLTIKSASTVIATMLFPANSAGDHDHDPGGLYITAKNEALVISRSGATAVGGYIRYKLVD
jgi:hypothetical protein